jgi:hypothetical protein
MPVWSSIVGDAHYDDPVHRSQQRHLRLAEPFIGKLKKFETPPLQDQSFGAEQNPGEKKQDQKVRTKRIKVFY